MKFNTPNKHSVRFRQIIFLVIFLGCTMFLGEAMAGNPPVLGDPPVSPPEEQQRSLSINNHAVFACSSPDCRFVYLPIVTRLNLNLDRQTALNLYLQEYLPTENVPDGWTGNRSNCEPGTTSQTFRDAILQRINYFRQMAGVPNLLGLTDEKNRQAQAAALMMSVNNQLNHTPPSSWTCYTEDGRQGAGSSDLFLGVYGPDAITGYIFDYGDGNTAAGHRRWILDPPTEWMGTGDIPPVGGAASNALFVFDDSMWNDRPITREEFVAWPPPGYVPYLVVNSRWSFAYPQADFSQAHVSMTLANSSLPVTQFTPVAGFGENTLVWQINGASAYQSLPRPANDQTYTVSITHILIGGVSQDFTYAVILFDPAN